MKASEYPLTPRLLGLLLERMADEKAQACDIPDCWDPPVYLVGDEEALGKFCAFHAVIADRELREKANATSAQ